MSALSVVLAVVIKIKKKTKLRNEDLKMEQVKKMNFVAYDIELDVKFKIKNSTLNDAIVECEETVHNWDSDMCLSLWTEQDWLNGNEPIVEGII